MHVCVDEAGHDVAPSRVDDLAAVVLAETGDPPVRNGDVGVQPLAREDGKHAPAAHDHVRGLVPAGNGETSGEVVHAGGSYYPWRRGRAHAPHARGVAAAEIRDSGRRPDPGRDG